MLDQTALRQQIKTALAAFMRTAPAPRPEPEPEPTTVKTLADLVTEFSEWETELWQRYGRVFYPQTEAGRMVFTMQKQARKRFGRHKGA